MVIIEQLIAWLDTAPANERVKAADALVRAWLVSEMSVEEREAAEAAMTCLLDDPDEEVRLAIARNLADVAHAPRHLVIALAADNAEVSLPILEGSAALVDGELINVINAGDNRQQAAIASRGFLSEAVSHAIATIADEQACILLLTNPEALVSEESFFILAERFGAHEEIRPCMLARHDIGMRARTHLIECYAASLFPPAEELSQRQLQEINDLYEKAIITYAAQISVQEVFDLVKALIAREKLTTAFLLRAICMGNLTLCCQAFSVLAQQPRTRVEKVLKSLRVHTFHAIYERADLPASAERVFFNALTSWNKYLSGDQTIDSVRLQYLVTKEVLGSYEGRHDATVDSLLVLLRRICADAARESARSSINQIALEKQQAPAIAAPVEEEATGYDALPRDLSEEELAGFILRFADELASQSDENVSDLEELCSHIEPANNQSPEFYHSPESSFLDLELPEKTEKAQKIAA